MRLNQYLTEELNSLEDILFLLRRKCGPFISMCKETGNLFYRGMRPKPSMLRLMRDDREPMNTYPWLHKYMNEMFTKKFGWPVRSGIFAAKSFSYVEGYGITHVVFGIGDFDYCWSPKIKDLFYTFNDPAYQINFGFINKYIHFDRKEPLSLGEVETAYLQALIDSYTDKNIDQARPNTEISFNFPQGYYALTAKLNDEWLRKELL